MKKCLLILIQIIYLSGILSAQPSATPLGMNLSRLYSYSSEIPFVDVFKQSENWTATNATGGSPTSVNVPLDVNGYPLEIPYDNGTDPAQIVSTVMLDIADGRYPGGIYTLMFEGDGEIELGGDASGTFNQNSGTGTYTFTVTTPSPNGILLTINRSDAADYVKDIRVIMPGHENTYLTDPFYPAFLQKLQGFSTIRFMDWTRTNGAWWITWSQRNLPTYRTHAISGGVPYEWVIALCNELNTDMWINIPHQVDDNYITQLAILIRDNLNSNLKVYIEYSNELWNGGFSQYNWAINQGFSLGLGPSGSGQTGRRFAAKRCVEIFTIFETEFGTAKTRLVKTLAGQATNTTVATQLLAAFALPSYNGVSINPNGIAADAFAIAPYFGGPVADDIGDAGLINSITVQEILDSAEIDMVHPSKQAAFQWHKSTAEQNNMALIAYEGGQHLVASASYQSNNTLTQKLIAANRDNRIYDLYRDYFDNWFNNLCGGVMCHFDYARVPNAAGSWGAVEYPAQPVSETPKYRALRYVIDTPQVLSAGFNHAVTGFNVSFTNSSTHANTYSWNFGDGSAVNTSSAPAHTYSASGQYSVSLTAANACDTVVTINVVDVSPISINATVSKASGVTPLGVFFDASGTTHTDGTIRPFHDLDFAWDFGDPASGNWNVTGLSKNTGKGGVYAHVFEQPGTYTVTLTVKDPNNNQEIQQFFITVTDPTAVYSGMLTRCVSTTGDFTGAPAGAQQITSNDFDAQILWLLASNGPRRLLLRRGDTLVCNASTSSVSNVTGPFTIGAYGSGPAQPVVNSALNTPIDLDSSIFDLRIMDIEFNGLNNTTARAGIVPGTETLVLRAFIKNHSNGVSTSSLFGNKARNLFVDNVFDSILSYNIYYNFGMHVAVMGNILNDVVDEHLIRSYCTHTLFAHNQFLKGEGPPPCSGPCGTQFKFVGYHPTGNPNRNPGEQTEAVEYTILSDNIFEQPENVYSVVMGPVDATKDQRIENCIFERNIMRAGSLTRRLLTLQGGIGITVRNNTFDFSNSPQIVGGVIIEQLGIEPAPIGHHVYNNTFYKGDVLPFRAVTFLDATSSDIVIKNNLAYAPLTTDAILINGSGTNLTASNNIGYFPADPTACVNSSGGSTCVNPMLVNPAGGNYHLQSGSLAIDAGVSLSSVLEDFDGNSRPQDGNSSSSAEWDIGAYEYTTSCSGLSANVAATNINCYGNNNGFIDLSVSGGTAQYTYSWSNNATTEDISGLSPNSYTCLITDANLCTVTKTVTITQPTAAVTATVTAQTNVLCFGNNTGTAAVSGSGGTGSLAYSWNTIPTQNTSTATGLIAGDYTCTITDNNSCATTKTITIAQPSSALTATVTAQTNILCYGNNIGSASVSGSGGTGIFTYAWNTIPIQSTATSTGLIAGDYTCTITDANSCTVTKTANITQPAAAVTATVTSQVNVSCFGNNTGSASVSASGGTGALNYAWNSSPVQNTSTATGLIAGDYTCTITDNNSCTTEKTISITQPSSALTTTVAAKSDVLCYGNGTGTATVAGSGGTGTLGYTWNTVPVQNTPAFTGMMAGDYTCTVTDVNSCSATQTITIAQPALAVTATITAQTNVLCYGNSTGAATVLGSGGTGTVTYVWNSSPIQNTSLATGLGAGSYTCNVTDANGCTSSTNTTITQPVAALSSSLAVTPSTCGNNNGSAIVTPAGGTSPYTYSWSNGGSSASVTGLTGLPTNTLIVTINDANGCTHKDTAYVNCVVSVAENNRQAELIIMPNPSNGFFELMFTSFINGDFTIELTSQLGQVIFAETLNNFSEKYSKDFDLSALGKGIYFINVKNENSKLVSKIVTY